MKKKILLLLCMAILLSGCRVITEDSPFDSKSAAPKIVPGTALVDGTLLNINSAPIKETAVHFAQVYREKGKAAFLYDAGSSPSTMTDKKGNFSLAELAAGEYVVIVGDPMTSYRILLDENGESRVIVAQGGQTVNLGELIVDK